MKDLESIHSIFKDALFKIPDYQRGYSWSKKQLVDFWEDIVNLTENKKHYTGVLTFKKVDEEIWTTWNDEIWLIKDRDYKPFHVVDGQQRMTTIVIFIQTLIEIVQGLPENSGKSLRDIYIGTYSLEKIKETYLLISKPPNLILNTHLFGYEKDNPSFLYLKHKILNESGGGKLDETLYTLNLESAKDFFLTNIRNVYDENGLEELEKLFRKVTQNLMFNKYEIDDDFDVFVAFETMNNRGKQLSNLELLKNRLIYLTTLYNENQLCNEEKTALRKRINDSWKNVYHQLGRKKEKKKLIDDDLLLAHWIIHFPYTRKKGNDYVHALLDETFTPKKIFKKLQADSSSSHTSETPIPEFFEDEDPEEMELEIAHQEQEWLHPRKIEEYVTSLETTAVHWHNTHYPIDNQDLEYNERIWLDRLNRIGIIYFRPLITASFMAPNIESAHRVTLFEHVERFIFITFRMGRASSSYRNSEFYRLARQLALGKTTIGEILKTLEARMSWSFKLHEGKTYFDQSFFQKYIQKKFQGAGGFYQWNGLRYFLYEYELMKVKDRGSNKVTWDSLFKTSEKDKVSIEHIYPQTPDHQCWLDSFAGIEEDRLEYLSNSLGNLMLLSMSINSSLQNDCFKDKKKAKHNKDGVKVRMGYDDGSHSEIEVSKEPFWTPQKILNRGLTLIKFMESRWKINFASEADKIELLHLNFLMDENSTEPNSEPK